MSYAKTSEAMVCEVVSDFLNAGIYVWCFRRQHSNENLGNSGVDIPYSYNAEVGVILKLVNLFNLHIMVTMKFHRDEEAYIYKCHKLQTCLKGNDVFKRRII